MSIIYHIFRYPDDLRNIVQQCNVLVLILQPLCHYNSSQSSHHDRTRRGRSTQSSSGKLTLILPFGISSFSIEVSQEVTEDSDPSEEVEPQYDCGKSVLFSMPFVLCTLMYNSIHCRKSYRRNQTLRMWLADSIFRTVLQMGTTTTAFGISLYGFVKTSTNKPSN